MSSSRGGAMSWLWRDDEEMAKKDDDLKLPGHPRHAGPWQAAHPPRRSVFVKRLVYGIVIFALVVILYRVMGSSSDASTQSSRVLTTPNNVPLPPLPVRRPEHHQNAHSTDKVEKDQTRDYSGKLKFPELATTLQGISATGGNTVKNRNVLFAAASLASMSTLLPLACQMAEERQNYVHFAIMSRSSMSILDILEINGIDSSCPLIMHDARPDRPAESTELRMAVASARAIYHINLYMHPQAILVDSTSQEESYLLSGIRDQVSATKAELVELPDGPGSGLSWLTKLDSVALAAWNKVNIDILIHAPAHGTGNLQRLLRSLSRADLRAVGFPRLTIELPAVVEDPLRDFLAGYRWPPRSPISSGRLNMLSLRHRISQQRLTEEESSIRFLELYWPQKSEDSYVLVLSPHTEVTPQFLNFVKYSILHHTYSSLGTLPEWKPKMMGISFTTPTTLLDGSQPLTLPDTSTDDGYEDDDTSFVYQAPASEAILFPASKWMELHGYVSQVLEVQASTTVESSLVTKKEISKKYPSWLEHVLRLSRLRGYYTVYPGKDTANTILGVHDDLYTTPEEYESEAVLKGDSDEGLVDRAGNAFDPNTLINMLRTLPNGGALPSIHNLPVLSWDGKNASLEDLQKLSAEYTSEFRQTVGQCKDTGTRLPPPDPFAKDLFCIDKGHA